MEKQWHARRQKNPAAKKHDFDCIQLLMYISRNSNQIRGITRRLLVNNPPTLVTEFKIISKEHKSY